MRSLAVLAVASGASLIASTGASASVFYTVNQGAWTTYATNEGASVATESFASVANGFYGTGVSGSLAGIGWTATASGGVTAASGLVSASTASATLRFDFTPGVNGIAGNLYGINGANVPVASIITVELSDSTTYIGYANGPSDFIGFYSTGATIASISLSVMSTGKDLVYATADNLYFATVPAPGAVALLGVAGIVSSRRRREA